MVTTVIVPENQDISIHIPKEFVGKEIGVLLYEISASNASDRKKSKPSDFAGTLSKENAMNMLNEVAKSREEWGRDF